MNKNLSLPSKIAIGLILLTGILNIFLSYRYMYSFNDRSEFAAMRGIAIGLSGIIIISISAVSMLTSIGLFLYKKWSFVLSILLMVLIFPVLSISSIEEVSSNITLIEALFIIKLTLPLLVILFLIVGRKDYKNKGTNK